MEPYPAVTSTSVANPVKVASLRRAFGWVIDYIIVMVPGLTLVGYALWELVKGLPGYVGAVAAEAGFTSLVRLFTGRGGGDGGLVAAASDEWLTLALPLLGALVALPMIQFLYHVTCLAWRGRTVGMAIVDARVSAMAGSPRLPRRLAVRRALMMTGLETGLVGVALLLIAVGQFSIGLMLWAVAILAFWVNALSALGPRGRTVIDRLARTIVVRASLHTRAAELTAETHPAVAAGRRGSAVVAAAGRRATALAAGAAHRASDALGVAGHLARQGAEAVAGSDGVQHALDSPVGQRVRAMGADGVDHARHLGTRAAERARGMSGRARQLWQDRQAGREQPTAPTVRPEANGQGPGDGQHGR
jgi:uncharacterized RDD family membrane protein YckC